ncbi:MAG: RnfABCDGE type electron transport complex subunit B [Alphaproteobacteria bacterium]|nr:RnfABCDGE type electron transport complex subunit B [Alphaproteobacteria bacterium]
MITALILNIVTLCSIAALAAVVLYMVSKKFAVEQSALETAVFEVLPHANCGACGKAGCQDFAKAYAQAGTEELQNLYCPVGGRKVMQKLAALKGSGTLSIAPTCAVLRCNGTCQNAPDKMVYDGLRSCRVANDIMSGKSGCPNGCLRLGDCVQVCQFGALRINPQTGIPEIDYHKCTSCGACVKRCPRGLFEIRPIVKGQQVYVACRNKQKGSVARKNCTSACIACGKCAKLNSEIVVENNLAYIPASVSPIEYGQKLADECPVKAIHYRKDIVKGESHEG